MDSNPFRDVPADVAYAGRGLRRSPGVALTVIATLALGIAVNATIFSAVSALLLRPLPFKDPERLVSLSRTQPSAAGGREGLSPADLFAVREHSDSLEAAATYRVQDDGFALIDSDRPELVYATYVSEDFFDVLGVPPLLGRTFTRGDGGPRSPFTVVVSYDFWRRRLQGDPNILGRPLKLAGLSAPIAGVMPPGFWFPRSDRADIWAIERMARPDRQGPWFFSGIGRLRASVTPAQAEEDLNAVAARVQATFPESGVANGTIVARPLRRELIGDMERVLLLMVVAAGIVLVIACVNVTNVLLARAAGRSREIAIRVALGASRGRVARLMLTETALLVAAGAAAGVLLARWGVAALVALTPQNLQVLRDVGISIDWRVLVACATISGACSLACGLAPALLGSSSREAEGAIRESGRVVSGSPSRQTLLAALVVAGIAVSVPLLVGAGLVTRSLAELTAVPSGVRTDHVLTTILTATPGRSPADFYGRLLPALRALPGVQRVAISDGLPPTTAYAARFAVEGRPRPTGEADATGEFVNIGGDYFATLGIPLRKGRTFDSRDLARGSNTLIVNESLAERFFPGADPIGRALRVDGSWVATIVGVVGDVKYRGLDATRDLTMYAPAVSPGRTMRLILRTSSDPRSIVSSLRGVIALIDPQVPLGPTRTMDDVMSDSIAAPRLRTTLLALFAITALALAAIGLYGVMAYWVSQRAYEIAIRIALGAEAGDVWRTVLKRGLIVIGVGVALGVAAALPLMRLAAGMLFTVAPRDPATFIAVSAILILVGVVACVPPAWRATRVDPLAALRAE